MAGMGSLKGTERSGCLRDLCQPATEARLSEIQASAQADTAPGTVQSTGAGAEPWHSGALASPPTGGEER